MSTAVGIKTFKVFVILFGFITSIYGYCNLQFPSDPLLRPKTFRIIGSRKIAQPVTEDAQLLTLFDNQIVELACSTNFEYPERYQGLTKVNLKCNENGYLNGIFYYNDNTVFKCSPLKWKLYESSGNFVWCPSNSTSYILARPMNNTLRNYEYLAGTCYNTESNSLKTLYYRMTPKYDNNYHPSVLEKFYTPISEIEHYREIFRKRSVNVENYENEVFRDWMKFSNFNLSSILQIPRINNEFYAGYLLDLVWWPSLRLGNWKRYEMALEKHIESAHKSYDILAGLSDVVKAPVIENCNTDFTLKVLDDNVNRQLPFYVWNYLRATDNSSEIVIIAVNSPFYEFYDKNDVIFCKDKCREISWLKATSSTFRYSALGIIFCCSVDEVKTSKRLEGFPTVNMDSLPQQIDYIPFQATTPIASEPESEDYD